MGESVQKGFRLPGAVGHVGALTVATVVGQVFLLLASPLITRLFSPNEFGSFNALLGVATILATLFSLSYPRAIPLTATREESSELFWLLAMLCSVIGPLTIFAVYLFLPIVGKSASSFLTELEWVLLAGTAVLLSIWGGLRAVASREDQFKAVAVSGVVDSGLQAAAQAAFGLLTLGGPGLAGGYLAGKAAAVCLLGWKAKRYLLKPRRPWTAGKRWIRMSLLVTPTTLLNQASVTAVSSFVALLYGATTAGQFSLASRILAAPAALVGQAVATVFFPRVARLNREGRRTRAAVETVANGLTQAAVPVFGVTALLGPELFSFVFGGDWREAGVAASILSPWLALNLISSPIASVATVHQRLTQLLILGVFEASLRLGALALGGWIQNWHLGLILYSAAGCAISLYTTSWVLRLSGGSLWLWLRTWPKSTWGFVGAITLLATLKLALPTLLFVPIALTLCVTGGLFAVRNIARLLRLR